VTGPDGHERDEPTIVVSNEFAAVTVRKVSTRNGERLEIRSMGHDQAIKLDALALEALTWSTPLEVGRGLETPLGPDPSQPHATDDGDGR
jgi:hypothetical protein